MGEGREWREREKEEIREGGRKRIERREKEENGERERKEIRD